MPVYYYWGEDEYQLKRAVERLRQTVVDPAWASFNYQKLAGDALEAVENALAESRTLPFGSGGRLTWITDAPIGKQCPEEWMELLLATIPQLPESSHVLFTGTERLAASSPLGQLFQKYGVIREFNPIPPWRTEELAALVREMAQEIPVALSQEAVAYLVAAIGNDRYRLEQELHKIALLRPEDPRPLQVAEIQPLVPPTTQTSLALAQAIRQGQVDQALHLWQDLLGMGEPPLRITATLVSQFRLWLWVKLAQMDRQVTPEKVVAMTNLGNPKRLYFLSKEVQGIPLAALAETLERLLALEWGLKQGAPATVIGPSTLISLSRLYSRGRFPAQ